MQPLLLTTAALEAGAGLALLGILSIVLGGTLLGNTVIGVAVLPFVIGIAELIGGVTALFLAFRLRLTQAR